MSSAIPGREAARSAHRPGSIPVAQVSRSALDRNVARALTAYRGDAPPIADVRSAAFGHGSAPVHALHDAGVTRFLADDDATRALAARVGGSLEAGSSIAASALDMATVLGLPGGSRDATPALRLSGTVLGVKPLLRGEGVSYGYLFRAAADTRVALVTGGYAQGVMRSLGGRIDVAIDGARHPVIGRIAMDVCVVDVGDAQIARGAEAVFLGDPARDEPALAQWAAATGLSAVEIITTVGLRAAREDVA